MLGHRYIRSERSSRAQRRRSTADRAIKAEQEGFRHLIAQHDDLRH
jgi:hypothetical protein